VYLYGCIAFSHINDEPETYGKNHFSTFFCRKLDEKDSGIGSKIKFEI
jgi:hypothetical protein